MANNNYNNYNMNDYNNIFNSMAAAGAGSAVHNYNHLPSGIEAILNLSNVVLSDPQYGPNFNINIDNMINEAFVNSFNVYDVSLQDRIHENELYTRSENFDNCTQEILQYSTVSYMLTNGLNNRYTPENIIANIFAYYCINYPDENLDNLKHILRSIGGPIIRRHRSRQNILLSFLQEVVQVNDEIQQQHDYLDHNNGTLTDSQFNRIKCNKFKNYNNIDNKCSICNELYESNDDVIELNCSLTRTNNINTTNHNIPLLGHQNNNDSFIPLLHNNPITSIFNDAYSYNYYTDETDETDETDDDVAAPQLINTINLPNPLTIDHSVCEGGFETKSQSKQTSPKNINTPPNHYFHKDCIYEWVTKHRASCPLCRTNINI